jgi:5-(carboxyamino)imidazole ribonucleotide synthase
VVNLVGEDDYTGDVVYENIAKILNRMGWVTPHIYGKKQTRLLEDGSM